MNDNLIIRKATMEDIEQLIELRKELLSNNEDTHYSAKNKKDDNAWQQAYKIWIEDNLHNQNIGIFVGEFNEDKNICACVIGIIDSRAPMVGAINGKMGWAQSLVVHKDRRGLRVAESIMKHLHNWFKKNSVNKIVIQSSKMGEEFNRKQGYIETGEKLLFKVIT